MLKYQSANVKSSEIASEAYAALYPADRLEIKQNYHDVEELKSAYKDMLTEDSGSVTELEYEFLNLTAKQLFPPIYDSEGFEDVFNIGHKNEYSLNNAYLSRMWLYILGSLLLACSYILHRRDELKRS